MAYFSRLMRNTGIRVGGPHRVQRTEDITPLEVDEFQEETRASGIEPEPEEAPVISRAAWETPQIARKEAAPPPNPRQVAAHPEPMRGDLPENALTTSVLEQQIEMPGEPSVPAAVSVTRESTQSSRSPVVEQIVYQERQPAPVQAEPAVPDAPPQPTATGPAQAPDMRRPTFAEVREWVAASPQPRIDREQPRVRVSSVPVRDGRPIPEPAWRSPELPAFEQAEAAPPVAVENFTLSIGTIQVTVEEPLKPVIAPVQPATRRDPPRENESSRLSRRYIRF